MPRSKPPRRAPGSSGRAASSREERPATRGESRGGPGHSASPRVVHDGGPTRRRGAGAGPAVTPTGIPDGRFENDTDAPDADLWR